MTMPWPEITFKAWHETCAALHLCTQVVRKYRLPRSSWINHSWHATLYVNAREFTTSTVPDGPGGIEIEFDLLDHKVIGSASGGRPTSFELAEMSVADVYSRLVDLVARIGGTPEIHGQPNEIASALPFREDHQNRPYHADAVTRYFQAGVQVDRVFKQFRTGYLDNVSPLHLFWVSFDLAVIRPSGRLAPRHPGGVPAFPDEVSCEAYSHEVSSAGFWPGGGGVDFPSFYSYAYPAPEGFTDALNAPQAAYFDTAPSFSDASIVPQSADFDTAPGEFILPYDAVRSAEYPDATLMQFLETTYDRQRAWATGTRFGGMWSQMATLLDQASGLWAKRALHGKVGGAFASSATQQGGQETTLFTIIANLLHFGMRLVGLNYGFAGQMKVVEATGRAPYVATTIAGTDGLRCRARTSLQAPGARGAPLRKPPRNFTAEPCDGKAMVCWSLRARWGGTELTA
ncbi:hypothetical protein GCM10010994_38430 [Chelatococcus reniformis]|uniref:Uncharacterized protein n=1 Tax=Chelatococcus reniformis TaxID=1494448 RepID=A0A916UK30_9HYPH|nr:hypothetical protein GCM10010994_38430 [Chelatococcus reniformis]